jgi:DNA-binding XRE family transcriptional regulator
LGPEDVEIVDYPKKKCLRKEENYDPDSYTSCTTHPGEMLLEEFLNPMSLTQRELADAIHVSYQRINDSVHGRRSVTPSWHCGWLSFSICRLISG